MEINKLEKNLPCGNKQERLHGGEGDIEIGL